MILTVACAASQSRPVAPWRVEVATGGGFAGKGMGTYAVDSAGKVAVTTMVGRSCTFDLADGELRNLEEILAASKPEQWGRYIPENPCCDRIEYTLTFEEAGQKHQAVWIDDPLPMPDDLVKLAEAMANVRRTYTERCR